MSAWRGALPLSTYTLKIASGLALRLASVLKVVYLRGSQVPLAKPSPTNPSLLTTRAFRPTKSKELFFPVKVNKFHDLFVCLCCWIYGELADLGSSGSDLE